MRKLIFIIVLFFSTSVFAQMWEYLPSSDMNDYINKGFKIIDVQKGGSKEYPFFTYSLMHPNIGFRICSVSFNIGNPYMTVCYKEKEN